MALDGTYAGLQASVASWLNRTDLTAVIPDFVTIAESKIARDLRLRKQIKTGTILTVTGSRNAALPSDWIEFENLNVDGSADTPLTYVTTAQLDEKYPENGFSGKPAVYSMEGDNVQFGPQPDIIYTINVSYYARFAALSTGVANWLFTNHPNVYLYACLREGCLFTKDSGGSAQWDGLYKTEVASVQKFDDESLHSGSVLAVKKV